MTCTVFHVIFIIIRPSMQYMYIKLYNVSVSVSLPHLSCPAEETLCVKASLSSQGE